MIDWPTYNDLRATANAESLSYGELMLIQSAFSLVPDEQLSDQREYALADDMLDEIATFLAHGHDVFVTDDGIVPTCDLCAGPQRTEGDDWNGETGNHRSCEEQAGKHELEPEDGSYRCTCGETFQIDSEGVEEAFVHGSAGLTARIIAIADMGGSAADQCQALYELAEEVRA